MRGDRGFLRLGSIAEINDRASDQYPAVEVAGHLLHVCQWQQGDWQVWVNTEAMEFDGLCIGTGETRDEAVAQAVHALEAITEKLQGPPW